ncbi:MAG: hypothetical protein WDZ94_01715 [Patescibacteria group bacterium]
MPVTSNAVSIGTTAVKIVDAKSVPGATHQYYDPNIQSKFVFLQDGAYSSQTEVYIGGPSVTTSNGVKMSKSNVTAIQLFADDELYAIATDTDGEIRVTQVA